MNENENYDLLFNPQTEIKTDSGSGSSEEFKPSAAKGKNNVYKAIVRFIPWYEDPRHGSIREKWTCFLIDPVTENGKYVDCPSSIGKPSPLQDMYFKCKNSENVQMQAKKEIFSRRRNFAALVQIIRNEQDPDQEGKILVWKFGVKIWEKINAELKPILGDPHDPFDILKGKAFAVVITKVSGYNNYDQSKFLDKTIPLLIPNSEEKLIPITESSEKKEVFDWVKDNSPDLSKYDYQEWNQEISDYVNHVIVAVTGKGYKAQNYASVKNTTSASDDSGSKDTGITSTDINIGDLDTSIDVDLPDIPETDSGPSESIGIPGDDIDDILKGL